ncbi:MAG: pyruvate:ferredoxin (flavodoxin) oxidoreductase, partial [Erysipelotrichaceae bacterium]|nr:pyruvate:ferredoxin (flavodoxin) oxidoreductase [Erysipelotrichaceae bacterium]
ATGCSSIYGASFPAAPYTTNAEGRGPAWANSLFEDNAEFGYGMTLGYKTMREKLEHKLNAVLENCKEETKAAIETWKANKADGANTIELSANVVKALEAEGTAEAKAALEDKAYLVKQSNWIFGGDGWAYDIGYGGLDHVIANQEDVNIFVIDTEVYSNTGGQSSKSSRTGSIAKFTAGGKNGKKKDLAAIAMSYGHVYVATICHGANPAQMIKALKEAESYNGPSLIIAYAPCQLHGIKGGMANHQEEQKKAIECGYFNLLRYDPRLEAEGKNPLQLDSKEPDFSKFQAFLAGETRFSQLAKVNPAHAQELMEKCEADAKKRRARLVKMA